MRSLCSKLNSLSFHLPSKNIIPNAEQVAMKNLLLDHIKFGVHIPVMGFDGNHPTKEEIISFAQHAEALGYDSLSANDHIVFHTSWLDALSTISVVAASTTRILIGTSILNIVVRNPVVSAKALAAIDILSSGRLFAGVGPGSHRGDYDACGIDFNQRWPRFSEALQILVRLLRSGDNTSSMPFSYKGKYYTLKDIFLTPKPIQKPHPPIYVGSWGSDIGLKRLAKYSNGWMASAYNITPAKFKEKWNFLLSYRRSLGKEEQDQQPFDNSVMSMFGYIHDEKEKVLEVVKKILSPALRRPAEDLERMLLFGSSDECLRKIENLVDAGVKRIHFWPVVDYENQIRIFKNEVCSDL
jgi:alkanesulfonate monooxygenase SsuD/methylene tetrahydromethanopterin reductase-like flavin-dependent oxidoreductase (luciferase family)